MFSSTFKARKNIQSVLERNAYETEDQRGALIMLQTFLYGLPEDKTKWPDGVAELVEKWTP